MYYFGVTTIFLRPLELALTAIPTSNKKLPFLDLEVFILMDVFLQNMLIHHIHIQHSNATQTLGQVWVKKLCPNLTPMCSLFVSLLRLEPEKHVIGNKNHGNWKDSWSVLLRKVTQVYAQVGILCDPKWEGMGEESSP